MEKKLNFNHLGIDFLVVVKTTSKGELEKVLKVRVWDDNNDKYITVPCNLEKFKSEMCNKLVDLLK